MQPQELLINEISKEITGLWEILQFCGFKLAGISFNKDRLLKAPESELQVLKFWLTGFRADEVAEVERCRNAIPAYMWDWYKTMDLKGFAEQQLLIEAKKRLRESWLNRPELLQRVVKFKKAKKK